MECGSAKASVHHLFRGAFTLRFAISSGRLGLLAIFLASFFLQGCSDNSNENFVITNANGLGPVTNVQFGVRPQAVNRFQAIPGVPAGTVEVEYRFCDASGRFVTVSDVIILVTTSNPALARFQDPPNNTFQLANDARGIRISARLPATVRTAKIIFRDAVGNEAVSQVLFNGVTEITNPPVVSLPAGTKLENLICDFDPRITTLDSGTSTQLSIKAGATDITNLFNFSATGPIKITNDQNNRGLVTAETVDQTTSATVTATLGTKVKTLTFDVVTTSTKTIEVRPRGGASTTLVLGQTLQLDAFEQPGNMAATGTWEVFSGSGTVDPNGLFQSNGSGASVVRFTQTGTQCTGDITITVANPTGVRILPRNPRRGQGTRLPLRVEVSFDSGSKVLFTSSMGSCTFTPSNQNCSVNSRGICTFRQPGSCQMSLSCTIGGQTFLDSTNCQVQNLSILSIPSSEIVFSTDRDPGGSITIGNNLNLNMSSFCYDSSCNFGYTASSNGTDQFINTLQINNTGQIQIIGNFTLPGNVGTIGGMTCEDFLSDTTLERRIYCTTSSNQILSLSCNFSNNNICDSFLGSQSTLSNPGDCLVVDKDVFFTYDQGVQRCPLDNSFVCQSPVTGFSSSDFSQVSQLDVYQGYADDDETDFYESNCNFLVGDSDEVAQLNYDKTTKQFTLAGRQTHAGNVVWLSTVEAYDDFKTCYYFFQQAPSAGTLVFHSFTSRGLGAFNTQTLSSAFGLPQNGLFGGDVSSNSSFIDSWVSNGSMPSSQSFYQSRIYDYVLGNYAAGGGTPLVVSPPQIVSEIYTTK